MAEQPEDKPLTEMEKIEEEDYTKAGLRLTNLERLEIRKKATIFGWNPEEIRQERLRLLNKAVSYTEQREELEARARDLGFPDYATQKREAFKRIKNPKTFEKVVIAPPLVKKVEAVEFASTQSPGELVLDESGKLLKSYFDYEGQIGSLIDQYNNFTGFALQEHIMSRHLVLPVGKVTFENFFLTRPMTKKLDGRPAKLYPLEARNSGYSYVGDMYIDFVLNKGLVSEERIDKVFIGKIPVMLSSELCWLHGKSQSERVALGETIAGDPYGYFIIKGQEKIVLIQEKLAANRIFVFNSDNKGKVVCKVTNNTIHGSTQITMTQGKKSGAIKLHLGFMGRMASATSNKVGRTVTLFQIFRMLGVTKTETMLDFIYLFVRPTFHKKVYVLLQASLVKLSKIGDDIEYISKKKGLGDAPYVNRKADIMNDLYKQLFPQIEFARTEGDQSTDHITDRLYMLSMMAGRFLEYLVGARGLDDRDNWANKQLVSAGKSLELLFSSIWREVITAAQKDIDDKKLNGLRAAQRSINSSFITNNFIDSFTANNWGVKSSYLTKDNITDILKRESILSVFSHLTRVNTPGSKKSASTKVRMVQISQLGYIDAAETPEGEMCLKKGTRILMANDTWKAIEDLRTGDVVVTVHPTSYELQASSIEKPFNFFSSEKNKDMYKVTLFSKKNKVLMEIEGTGDHPFLTQYGWIPLDKLNPEYDSLCVFSGNEIVFAKKYKIERTEAAQVYDFTTISENHSFIAEGFVTHNCGLTKNLASTCYASLERPENIILELIGQYVSSRPSLETPSPFVLNGLFRGWVAGAEMRDFCIRLRRNLTFQKDTTIVLDNDGSFNIYTDGCRPTRPLLILENGELVIEKKNLWDADFDTLLHEGCVEYIGAWEQSQIMLAQSIYDVRQRKVDQESARRSLDIARENLYNNTDKELVKDLKLIVSQSETALKEAMNVKPYTHCELDPTATMSTSVAVIPLPETIPGPRLTYQAGMGKQGMGIDHSNHGARFDTTRKLLAYPSRPMFETQMNSMLGLNELPAGETVIVAITTYSGFAQEDAIVMKRGSVQRGLFRSIILKTYKSIRRKNKNQREEFTRPEITEKEKDKYLAIGEDGLPKVGSLVREGDCLIGKVRKILRGPSLGKIENVSTFVELKQEGVVDRVLVSTNPEGDQVVKVKIREVREPVLGDKFACYTAEHEVLTRRGWVYIDELESTDFVASLEDGGMEYRQVIDLQSYDYDGDIFSIRSRNVDLNVTTNHRMYVRRGADYEVLRADEIDCDVYYTDGANEFLVKRSEMLPRHFKGKVYCCSVPSGIIYVRKGVKEVYCGNSRYAQKGTIGMILPDEDMPFTADGISPDLIINPLSIPSRMTIGKMIEFVTSKVAAFTGERINATGYRRFNVEEFSRNLLQYGYSSSGSERMMSGIDGKQIEARIFIGPCYYLGLKHQVEDKIQMRARGGVSQLTRQPVSGRKRGGGLRLGEMERDAMISHGAASFMQERLCTTSDALETVFCSTCGRIAIANIVEEKYACRVCEDNASFGKCTIPTSYKLLSQLLSAAGIQTRFKMREVQKK